MFQLIAGCVAISSQMHVYMCVHMFHGRYKQESTVSQHFGHHA